jgi:RNA methyltransferase, TrmH family
MMQSKQLTSLVNPDVKKIVRLRDRKERVKTGLMIVEGPRELTAALEANVEVKELYVCKELFKEKGSGTLAKRLSSYLSVTEVTPEVFAKIGYGDRLDGVLAVCAIPRADLKGLSLKDNPLVVIVENLEKPGNLGAILRSCDGAGVDAMIVADKTTDIYNPNVIRASVGTVFSLPVVSAPNEAILEFLNKNKMSVYAAVPQATQSYTQADFRKSCAIVLGSEEKGLSVFWKSNAGSQVTIPMKGKADSLNVSTTAAILIYEALRQRA